MEARLEYKKTYEVEHVEDAFMDQIDNAKSVKKFERVKCRV
jgi:hypothetical protein